MLALLLLIGVSAAVLLGRRRFPYLLVGWFWYLGMFVPMIGLVQVGSHALADRYTYLPQIGLTLGLVWLLRDFCCRPLVPTLGVGTHGLRRSASATLMQLACVTAAMLAATLACWPGGRRLFGATAERFGPATWPAPGTMRRPTTISASSWPGLGLTDEAIRPLPGRAGDKPQLSYFCETISARHWPDRDVPKRPSPSIAKRS